MGTRKTPRDVEALEDEPEGHNGESPGADEFASVSFVNGFVTAVVVSPKFLDPVEWLSPLLDVPPAELTANAEVAAARELLLIEHRGILNSLAARDGSYSPYFWEDDDGSLVGQDWAEGFLAGMELGREAWDRALEDEDLRAGLFLVFALLRDEELLASIEEDGGPTPEESLLAAQEELPLAVQDFFEASPHGAGWPPATLKDPEITVGRNDPCPCGSGKKYKKCCLN